MVAAADLLRTYSIRLGMNNDGITNLSPELRASIEVLVANLKRLDPNEKIEINADLAREPIARFVRKATGEIIGVINQPAELPDEENSN